jgi:hydroxymethylpyrimidine pyrophosphatase-like HAD family hydrolase
MTFPLPFFFWYHCINDEEEYVPVNKSTIILELDRAKLAHERWVNRAKHLINGLPVQKEFIPVEPTACGFGEWLYGPVGEYMRTQYIFERTIERIETCHDELHSHYSKIYKIFFDRTPKSPGLLHKLVKFNRRSVSKKKREEAKNEFVKLQKSSSELLQLIEKLEKAVRAVDPVMFLSPKKEM